MCKYFGEISYNILQLYLQPNIPNTDQLDPLCLLPGKKKKNQIPSALYT